MNKNNFFCNKTLDCKEHSRFVTGGGNVFHLGHFLQFHFTWIDFVEAQAYLDTSGVFLDISFQNSYPLPKIAVAIWREAVCRLWIPIEGDACLFVGFYFHLLTKVDGPSCHTVLVYSQAFRVILVEILLKINCEVIFNILSLKIESKWKIFACSIWCSSNR